MTRAEKLSPTAIGCWVWCVPSYWFSSRSPCQWTVPSMSPRFSILTTTVEPSCTLRIGPGIEPL